MMFNVLISTFVAGPALQLTISIPDWQVEKLPTWHVGTFDPLDRFGAAQ